MSDLMRNTARDLVAPGKGILAADESSSTIAMRFASIGVESTEENRRSYREMLFTAPGIGEWISGVILYDETIRQSASDGQPFPKLLVDAGIIPGIKVDTGTKDLAGAGGEKVTEGLDGLRERLADYRDLGARFAKWRAIFSVGDGLPSSYCINVNAHALARYAALCQEADLVPIVEPEVLMDGDHTIEECEQATTAVLKGTFEQLMAQQVVLQEIILKTNMVLAGIRCSEQPEVDKVASATLECLLECVPASVPGIAFLSGGQSDEKATAHLNAMNVSGGAPWALSFSYGRALQSSALKAWKGDEANIPAGQAALLHRAQCNSAATLGRFSSSMEAI